MKKLLKQLFCKHRHTTFLRNIYGDEIIHTNYARSIGICDNCGKKIYYDSLYKTD